MRKRFLGFAILITLVSVYGSEATAQRRPATQKPAASDLKITYKQTTSGQAMESTTMLKGSRERGEMSMGMGMKIVNITQCDLKRTIQISDTAQKYVITPMTVATASTAPASTPSTAATQPTRRGGVVTYTTTSTDTGERKEMFGFTARHIKSSLTIESSPDACTPMNQRIDTDGWYIDFSFGLQCDLGQAQAGWQPPTTGGCRDQVQFKNVGAARKGYPLQETMTMYGPGGQVMTTTTKEVLELSREPLRLVLERGDSRDQLLRLGVERVGELQDLIAIPLKDAQRFEACNRFDTTCAGRDAALGDNREQADVSGGTNVCSAAQLDAEAGNRHDADAVTVLLSEERHGAGRDRFLRVLHVRLHGDVPDDMLVDDALDLELMLTRDRPKVHEIEPETVGRYE